MENLEKLCIDMTSVDLKPITHLIFGVKNGAQFCVDTPLTIPDFMKLWDSHGKEIKILTGINTFTYVNKRSVDFFHISPLSHNTNIN